MASQIDEEVAGLDLGPGLPEDMLTVKAEYGLQVSKWPGFAHVKLLSLNEPEGFARCQVLQGGFTCDPQGAGKHTIGMGQNVTVRLSESVFLLGRLKS